jgi:hypothetical protein
MSVAGGSRRAAGTIVVRGASIDATKAIATV